MLWFREASPIADICSGFLRIPCAKRAFSMGAKRSVVVLVEDRAVEREMSSPHVVVSQALYAAKLATRNTPEDYEAEVFRQLNRIEMGLTNWEVAQVMKEMRFRLAASCCRTRE